jgi:hypothetical protein
MVADPGTDPVPIDPPIEVSVATRYLWYSVGVSLAMVVLTGFGRHMRAMIVGR